ncbi:MAG: triphosphoribosyl-dephospho-CoA synthase [Planctomycetota bacterium]|nr:triphosphoribosyl-dephospho-CoA synthase [Planctomycetota bacterium]
MTQLSLGQLATLACLMEVSAPKPGNVHRGADFDDLKLDDFQASAVAIGPAFDAARDQGIGVTILTAMRATQAVVSTNTNLGLLLLMAPLARSSAMDQAAVQSVLDSLTEQDSHDVYGAISLASAGGLGRQQEMDVGGPPPRSLLEAMQHAQDRDLIAAQYVNGFQQLFEDAVVPLRKKIEKQVPLPAAIVQTHVQFMSLHVDSLISRKCGMEVAHEATQRAQKVLRTYNQDKENYESAVGELDFWLRSDGHRRNPGTTADFIGAAIFVGLIDGWITQRSVASSDGK